MGVEDCCRTAAVSMEWSTWPTVHLFATDTTSSHCFGVEGMRSVGSSSATNPQRIGHNSHNNTVVEAWCCLVSFPRFWFTCSTQWREHRNSGYERMISSFVCITIILLIKLNFKVRQLAYDYNSFAIPFLRCNKKSHYLSPALSLPRGRQCTKKEGSEVMYDS